MKNSKLVLILGLTLIAIATIGCSGNNKFLSGNELSMSAKAGLDDVTCNSFHDADQVLGAKVGLSYDYSRIDGSIVLVPTEMHVQMTDLPDDFFQGNIKVRVFGFQIASDGTRMDSSDAFPI